MSKILKNGLLIAEILNGDNVLAKEVGLYLTPKTKELLQDEENPFEAAAEKLLEFDDELEREISEALLGKINLTAFEEQFKLNDALREIAAEYFAQGHFMEIIEAAEREDGEGSICGPLRDACAEYAASESLK